MREINSLKFWEDSTLNSTNFDNLDIPKLQYFNCLKNRIIILNSRIDDDAIESITLPLLALDNDGTGLPIVLLMNTSGGYIGSGFTIVDALEHMKTKTTIHISTEAFSMGFYIAMAGHNNPNVTTTCSPFARAMYHNSFLSECDEDEGSKQIMEFQKRYDNTVLADYVTTHSKITKDMLNEWNGKEIYFTAKELEELGIAKVI